MTNLSRTVRRLSGMAEPGLGCAQLGNLYRETSDEEAAETLETCWDGGVRYFDTAPHYGLGLSERRLGEHLRSRPRDEYLVSTKVGRLLRPARHPRELDDEGFAVPGDLERVRDYSRDGVLRSLEESLERLGLDRIDIVYIHDPDDHYDEAVEGAVPALEELRDQGVIGAWGVGMNQSRMLARFVHETAPDLVMCAGRYTLLEQGALDDLIPACREHGTRVVAVGVFNSGLLASPWPADDATYNYEQAPPELIERARRLAALAIDHGVTLPQAAAAFPGHAEEVAISVIGMRGRRQVSENLARYDHPIPGSFWTEAVELGLIRDDGAPLQRGETTTTGRDLT